jgi:RPA family protein
MSQSNASTSKESEFDYSYPIAVPVLDYEIGTIEEDFKPDTGNKYAVRKAVLPTGVYAGRVQYVARVARKRVEKGEYGKRVQITSKDGLYKVYIGANEQYNDCTERLAKIDRESYVSMTANVLVRDTDDGKASYLVPVTAKEVDQRTRNRFLLNAAEQTLDRIEAFQEEDNTPEQDHAKEIYGEDHLSQYANAVVLAIEQADMSLQRNG